MDITAKTTIYPSWRNCADLSPQRRVAEDEERGEPPSPWSRSAIEEESTRSSGGLLDVSFSIHSIVSLLQFLVGEISRKPVLTRHTFSSPFTWISHANGPIYHLRLGCWLALILSIFMRHLVAIIRALGCERDIVSVPVMNWA
jgi:hypothetical protein